MLEPSAWRRMRIGRSFSASSAPPQPARADPADRLQPVVARHHQIAFGQILDHHRAAVGINQRAPSEARCGLIRVVEIKVAIIVAAIWIAIFIYCKIGKVGRDAWKAAIEIVK